MSKADQRHVLVVDDDDDIREVAQLALQHVGGWQVTAAASGQEALDAAGRERPDAILLDVMMPDMDGPTTVGRLKGDPGTAGIPIILLTAKTIARDNSEWADLDLAGVISKPFDPMALPQAVAALLGWAG